MRSLKDSTILEVSITKLFPFVLMYSFYVFSYGANLPGGGFQAGVLFGTIVVIIEALFEHKIYPDALYGWIEFFGVAMLGAALAAGLVFSGFFFGRLYAWQSTSLVFSNIFYWILNLAIYLEVAGSIVLMFRNFLDWKDA